ncbi:MAG: hypothetical protein WC869_00830 [Phycisphaerae bacterium]|jgi:hypothetical protein
MTVSPDLLNAVASTEAYTTYDRSYGGGFDNPWDGVPTMTFFMKRVTFRDSDEAVIKEEMLPAVKETYKPGKTYLLRDPATGNLVPGQHFTTEQYYAMTYSMMRQVIDEAKLAAQQAAQP